MSRTRISRFASRSTSSRLRSLKTKETRMSKIRFLVLSIASLALAGLAVAQLAKPAGGAAAAAKPAPTTPPMAPAMEHAGEHIMKMPADLTWVDAPPSLPKGAKVAVLEGDPAKAGPFTIRLQLPAKYKVAP